MIDLDNGPAINSHRVQFIKRIVEFAQATGLRIRLVYYPPYHSNYNAIERCWAALEHYWNGAIQDTVESALQWASNMKWHDFTPIVELVETAHPKGVTLSAEQLSPFYEQWQRSETLPKWDVTIVPV